MNVEPVRFYADQLRETRPRDTTFEVAAGANARHANLARRGPRRDCRLYSTTASTTSWHEASISRMSKSMSAPWTA